MAQSTRLEATSQALGPGFAPIGVTQARDFTSGDISEGGGSEQEMACAWHLARCPVRGRYSETLPAVDTVPSCSESRWAEHGCASGSSPCHISYRGQVPSMGIPGPTAFRGASLSWVAEPGARPPRLEDAHVCSRLQAPSLTLQPSPASHSFPNNPLPWQLVAAAEEWRLGMTRMGRWLRTGLSGAWAECPAGPEPLFGP